MGGSDDHAGVGIGRTWTETPLAETPEEFLSWLRAGCASAHGEQGSAAKWAHAAMALAVRALGCAGLAAAHERSWEASLAALGAGWERALAFSSPQPGVAVTA